MINFLFHGCDKIVIFLLFFTIFEYMPKSEYTTEKTITLLGAGFAAHSRSNIFKYGNIYEQCSYHTHSYLHYMMNYMRCFKYSKKKLQQENKKKKMMIIFKGIFCMQLANMNIIV